jgi:sugar phosphate isomerase/epimerase
MGHRAWRLSLHVGRGHAQRSIDRPPRPHRSGRRKAGVQLLLENLNGEPERAEVHYMPDTLADTKEFLARIPSPNLKWSFTINHAHYDPLGIKAWVQGMDMSRCGEVRVADNNGLYELHMHPGTGTVDFVEMFRLIEGAGYRGPYTCGWGTIEQMLEGRTYLAQKAREAGST